jgi:hypothetical protein
MVTRMLLCALFLLTGGLYSQPAQKEATAVTKQFEYCELFVPANKNLSTGADRMLNVFGKEGWEIVSAQASERAIDALAPEKSIRDAPAGSMDRTFLLFFMKREIGEGGKSCPAIRKEVN